MENQYIDAALPVSHCYIHPCDGHATAWQNFPPISSFVPYNKDTYQNNFTQLLMGLLCLESKFPSLQITSTKDETPLPRAQGNTPIQSVLFSCCRS